MVHQGLVAKARKVVRIRVSILFDVTAVGAMTRCLQGTDILSESCLKHSSMIQVLGAKPRKYRSTTAFRQGLLRTWTSARFNRGFPF